MDPLTASLTLINKILDFAIKVYDHTPEDLKIQGASDWARFFHSISKQVDTVQSLILAPLVKINEKIIETK